MRLPSTVLLLIFTALVAALPVKYDEKKNIIFLVSDGLGLSGVTAAREYIKRRDNLTDSAAVLDIESYLIGSQRTRSASQLVTDSAAAGSALAAGVKTYNGAISVDPNGVPRGTFYEGAKLLDYKTGIVTTTFVQDATIATPNTHAISRRSYDLIATQQLGYEHPLGQVIDVVIGGGRQYLHGANQTYDGTVGARDDDVDYIAQAVEDGWTYIGNREDFDDLYSSGEVKLPLLGLFAANNFPYEIDRNASVYPSLAENSLLALETLIKATEDTEQGFVLLLEGARIDHAGHANDPATHALETLAFDQAWSAVIDRVSNLDTETLVVSTSDHETGGYGLAINNVYDWYPENLLKTPHSIEYASGILNDFDGDNITDFIITDVLGKALNIYSNYTTEDVEAIANSTTAANKLGELLSNSAGLGWTTDGHSHQDVPIYAYSNTKEGYNRILAALGSSVENTEIPRFFAKELGVDLDEITDLIANITTKPESD